MRCDLNVEVAAPKGLCKVLRAVYNGLRIVALVLVLLSLVLGGCRTGARGANSVVVNPCRIDTVVLDVWYESSSDLIAHSDFSFKKPYFLKYHPGEISNKDYDLGVWVQIGLEWNDTWGCYQLAEDCPDVYEDATTDSGIDLKRKAVKEMLSINAPIYRYESKWDIQGSGVVDKVFEFKALRLTCLVLNSIQCEIWHIDLSPFIALDSARPTPLVHKRVPVSFITKVISIEALRTEME